MPTVYYYCPECNYKALQIEIASDPNGVVQSYTCKCVACGYYYASEGQESEGKGISGELPDRVGRSPRDFGYILRRVVAIHDGDDLQCLPCKLDDPRRSGWAIFSINADGSLKRELFGNDLLAVTSAFEGPFDD
jgi:rubredoxin